MRINEKEMKQLEEYKGKYLDVNIDLDINWNPYEILNKLRSGEWIL